LQEARRELEAAVEILRGGGALVRSSHANLSVRLDAGRVAMTRRSTVADLERHSPDALCVVDLEGRVLEGQVDPAMDEVITMHTRVYQEREDVGSVIHTHAPHLTALAVAHHPLDLIHEPMLRVGVTRPVPVVPWAPRGSRESVEGIVEQARTDRGVRAVLLANHGVLAFAEAPEATARVLATLEEAAGLAIMAGSLGGAKALPDRAADEVRARLAQYGGSGRA
jgi:L-fuculose-phosphate aldolase